MLVPKIKSRKRSISLTGASQALDMGGDNIKRKMRNKTV